MKNTPNTNTEFNKQPKGFYANEPKDYNTQSKAGKSKVRKKYYLRKQSPGEGGVPKDKNSESVSEFISEGNPNTEKVIQETKDSAAQFPEKIHGFPEEDENDQSKEEHAADFYDELKLADDIQTAIENEDLISGSDKNVLVIVESGTVALKGTVSSEEVKQNIEDKAASFVGYSRVGNYLQVDQDRSR